VVGGLAGQQDVRSLKEGAKPESLPVLGQEEVMILVEVKQLESVP